MGERDQSAGKSGGTGRQPIFLLPDVITAVVGLLVAIQLATNLVLNEQGQLQLYIWFAFLPVRLLAVQDQISEAVPLLWTPFTHALLHSGWEHLLLNVAWLVIFGTPVARRYGTAPTLIVFFVAAAAGAVFFATTTLYSGAFLVGASGGIAGLTGAAVRFMFQPVVIAQDAETGERRLVGRKLASLREMLAEPRARTFTLFWIIVNGAVPLLPLLLATDVQIAWQAHLGGFVAGLLLVGWFDRRATSAQ